MRMFFKHGGYELTIALVGLFASYFLLVSGGRYRLVMAAFAIIFSVSAVILLVGAFRLAYQGAVGSRHNPN